MTRRPPSDLTVLASYYARWEPYEAKRREIADDLKELFKELKSDGLNAKSARKAFAEFYRIENQTNDEAEKRAENDADFELYLTVLARVREGDEEIPPHDEDGVILETSSTAARKDVQLKAGLEGRNTSQGGTSERAPSGTEAGSPSANQVQVAGIQAPPVETIPGNPAGTEDGTSVAAYGAPSSETIATAVSPQPAGADRSGVESPSLPGSTPVNNVIGIQSHDPSTHFLNAKGLVRLHGCQNADKCGSSQPRAKLCFGCSVKHDGPTAQVAAE